MQLSMLPPPPSLEPSASRPAAAAARSGVPVLATLRAATVAGGVAPWSIDEISNRFSDVIVRNDLCYATTNRQTAVKELARLTDLVLVIGAANSSNCNRLREVAEANGVTSYLLNGPDELDLAWLEGVDTVGITSGASTPDELVMGVIDAIGPDEVTTIKGADEDITFVLPRELR